MAKANKLKLFFWENVLQDYGYGAMFAYAKSVEQARELILLKHDSERVRADLLKPYREITAPEGFQVDGSA